MEDATHPPTVTRTNSLTSEVTGDNYSGDSVEHGDTVRLVDSLASESISTEWTDEKHSLYLKSMETSFVNQLYNSLDLLGWHSQKEHSSDAKSLRQMHANTRVSSGQFKVLRGGCWGKINFERGEPQLDKADGPRVFLANPWIRHFRSACRHQVVTSPAFPKKVAFESQAIHIDGKMALTSALAPNSKQFHVRDSHLCCRDSTGSNTEGSDQNFVDEDIKGDQASRMRSAKRVKTSGAASSSNNQVVPFHKFPMTEDVTENHVSLESERLHSNGWQSENKNGFL
uniref:Cold regulated protein 27 n=1 Tax=Davidia involucrata TaxID=16924 RepID=A0A5B6YXX7_DAVIN